ncbi:hypothetical protein Sango_2047800 [Sesamum angolense]|uniref:Uncharacterized protein n=1 Tax=Sesamum angolense TaxID=2727404 RepID=A0AAE1WFZ0_9LAMI|nr:hypothetical protein Sango_2047800 [Sesamum angolense]
MTWHATHQTEERSVCHPSDSEVWKHFDRMYLDFAEEPRNIRLGLCRDGFAPHGQYNRTYSYWSVIIILYNLSPGMCLSSEYIFLMMVCMDDTRAFHLDHDRKTCYFDYHRQFLPTHHSYRRNKKAFTKNRVKNKVARPRLTGDQILDWVAKIMSTGAPSPPGRGRRGQGHGHGPPSPPRAELADPASTTPSSEVVSQPPHIPADSGAVGSYAAGASSSQTPHRPSDRDFHAAINNVVKWHHPHPWANISYIPQEHQLFWFQKLKVSYWYCDDETMFKVIKSQIGKFLGSEFQAESAKNKVNRAANPKAAATIYRGESSSVAAHKHKLKTQLGRLVNQMEVFKKVYKKKNDGQRSGGVLEAVEGTLGRREQQRGTGTLVSSLHDPKRAATVDVSSWRSKKRPRIRSRL